MSGSEVLAKCISSVGDVPSERLATKPRRRTKFSVIAVSFAIVSAALMLLPVFDSVAQEAVAAGEDGYSYTPTSDYVSDQATSYDAGLMADTRGDDNGATPGYIRPHVTKSVYTENEPLLRTIGESGRQIVVRESSSEYSYETEFGLYSFLKSDPSQLALRTRSSTTLASSSFNLTSDYQLNLSGARVARYDKTQFTTVQSASLGTSWSGEFWVRTEFFDAKEPKMTAWLNTSASRDELSFSIVWNVILYDTHLRIANQILSSPDLVACQSISSDLRSFDSGRLSADGSWQAGCRIDWSDAGCGDLTLQYDATGLRAMVSFPKGMTYVDPTIVGPSSSTYATSGSPMRNVVYYDGVYWLFYSNVSCLLYSQSTDGGLTWSAPTMVPGSDYYGVQDIASAFDVTINANHIAVCWLRIVTGSLGVLCFNEGDISDHFIAWKTRKEIAYLNNADGERYGGVALAPSGTAFLAYAEQDGLGLRIHTWKKSSSDSSFVEFGNPFPTWSESDSVMPRLVSQRTGGIALVVMADPFSSPTSYVYWDIYVPEFDVWESSSNAWTSAVDISDTAAFSACPGVRNETHLALIRSDGYLQYTRLFQNGTVNAEHTNLYLWGASWPSISIDQASNLHVQYVARAQSGQPRKICEMHTGPGDESWSPEASMFPAQADNPVALTSGERLVARNFVSYVNSVSSPKQVMFGSLPLPSDVVGPYGDPWSQCGINQDQPFAIGVSDSISPGNGLLYLSQTDFVVPGRGTDMVVSRFFATPQYFVKDLGGIYVPYLYDQFPWCDLGEGWQLNLPWIDTHYVHLWGGAKVAIQWDGAYFNNTKSQPFVLSRDYSGFNLDLQDGMRVAFDGLGRPVSIYSNRMLGLGPDIQFSYGDPSEQNPLLSITDYLGRTVYLGYSGSYPNYKLQTISLFDRTVVLSYLGERLASVTDSIGLVTSFEYDVAGNPSLPITRVTYPTGGSVRYTYSTIQVGTDAIARVVSWRSDDEHGAIYSYNAIDGVITYTQVDDYDMQPRVRGRGSTEYNFDSKAKKTEVTYFEFRAGSVVPMKRTVSWYSPNGLISRAENYDDIRSMPDVVVSAIDNKGNTVYSRDPMGHEVFSSFANTSTQYAFYRPAVLNLTSSGKACYDDFNDWIDDGWIHGGTGTISINDYLADNDLDPSYKVTASGSTYSAIAVDPYGGGLSEVVLDCILMVKSTDGDIRLVLSNGLTDVISGVRFTFDVSNYNPTVRYMSPSGIYGLTGATYSSDVLYRISIHISRTGPSSYESLLYINGEYVSWWPSSSGSPIRYFRVQAEPTGTQRCAVIDNVKVFKNWNLNVNGVTSGQFVELYDAEGKIISKTKVGLGGTTATIALDAVSCSFMPYGNLVVRDSTGVVEIIDTYRAIWGGDTYQYSRHAYLRTAIPETSSYANAVSQTIMDDGIPFSGYDPVGNEPLNWISDWGFTLGSSTRYHHGASSSDARFHGYMAKPQTQPVVTSQIDSSGYFVQDVYLPAGSYPLEIGLRYYYQYQQGGSWVSGWSHMAYWGVDAIQSDFARVRMGDLPLPGQWFKLFVRASDINWNPTTYQGQFIRGIQFWHFSGDPYWDLSSCIDGAYYSDVDVSGLSAGQKVELRKPDGTLAASDTVTYNGEIATLALYAAGIRSTPFSGYLRVYDTTGQIECESPVFRDIYPCMDYSYSRSSSPFYSNPPTPSGFAKLPMGMMQFLDSAGTKSMESYTKYGLKIGGNWQKAWLVNETKVKNGTSWLYTKYRYDSYGNVIQVTDPTGATLNYSYSNSGTFLASTWIKVGTDNISQSYSYNNIGLLETETDAMGHITEYEYDTIGRVTNITYPQIDGELVSVRYVYDDINRIQTYYDENGSVQETDYDLYGRVEYVLRMDKPGDTSSDRSYVYQWNGKIEKAYSYVNRTRCEFEFSYDYLGRTTKVWNPDNSDLTTVYDDRNNTVITYDEMGRRKDAVYDASDRLIQSIQYVGSKMLYANMTYDCIGNLLNVTDPVGRWTSFEYDNMGRVVKTTSPGNVVEQYSYDSANRLLKRIKADGTITYKYDIAGRLKSEKVNDNTWKTYTYDRNGNVLEAKFKRDSTTTITVTRTYDVWDRVKTETTTIGSATYTLTYGYDNRSNVKSLDIAGLWTLGYGYDDFNRMTKVSIGGSRPAVFGQFQYNSRDQFTRITYGNNAVADYATSAYRGWVDRITTSLGGSPKLDLIYTHDYSGRITSTNANRVYVYDTAGRLAYANDTTAYGLMAFTYDAVGNRLSQVWNSVVTTYAYYPDGGLWQLTNNTANIVYTYDALGRLATKNDGASTWTYSYDAFDELVSVKKGTKVKEQFFYDAFGRMVKSVQDGVTETTIYSGSNPVYVLTGNTKTLHVYANGIHIAKRVGTSNPTDYYYFVDCLGSVRLVYSGSTAKFNTDYLPFGEAFRPGGSVSESFRFSDKRSTALSGLIQMGARYYDPLVGRFATPDSMMGSPGTPTSLNRYVYCLNDPINRLDASGQWSLFKKIANFATSVFNTATAVIQTAVALVGQVIQVVADVVVSAAETFADWTKQALDTAIKIMEDVKSACDAVTDAIMSGVSAIKEAWDNLDPGWKQWLLLGVSLAICMIPGVGIAGILLGCMIDGTFSDMWSAIKTGDWAMLGMSMLSFVPGGGKVAKAFAKMDRLGSMGAGKLLKAGKNAGRMSHDVHAEQLLGKGARFSDLDVFAKSKLKNAISNPAGSKFYSHSSGVGVITEHNGRSIMIAVHPQANNGIGMLGTCHVIRDNSVPKGWSEISLGDYLDGLMG